MEREKKEGRCTFTCHSRESAVARSKKNAVAIRSVSKHGPRDSESLFALVLLYSGIIASEICGSRVLVLAEITPKRRLKNAE